LAWLGQCACAAPPRRLVLGPATSGGAGRPPAAATARIAAAAPKVAARSAALPTSKCTPNTPSSTFSAMPPILEQMIGRPAIRASSMTTGEFSHQIDGTTIQSMPRISSITLRPS
jgi:hypothetical protein